MLLSLCRRRAPSLQQQQSDQSRPKEAECSSSDNAWPQLMGVARWAEQKKKCREEQCGAEVFVCVLSVFEARRELL